MDITPSLSSLTEKERTGFAACLAKIQQKRKLRRLDVENMVDDAACSGARVCRVFDVTKMSLNRWEKEGCPRNADGTYSLTDIYKWRTSKLEQRAETPIGIKEEKLKKEIEFLQARIDEKKDMFIERSLHETILTSRAGSLRTFFEKTFMANAVHLAGKTADEVRTLLYKLLQAAMQAYEGNSEE